MRIRMEREHWDGIVLALVIAAALFLTGCGQKWEVKELQVIKNERLHVELWGRTTKLSETLEGSPDAEIRIYFDEYQTLVESHDFDAGGEIEDAEKGVTQFFHYSLDWEFKVGNSAGQFKVICLDFKMKDSNYPDYTRIG